jgi:ribosomal protein S3AE
MRGIFMRKKRVRRQIEDTLRANPDGLTAGQILERLPSQRNVSDARHLANLLRGMKNIKKRKVKLGNQPFYAAETRENRTNQTWFVNEYYYEDEGAEI